MIKVWEFAVELMQLPLLVLIIALSLLASRVMVLYSHRWVALAFTVNIIYLLNSIWTGKYAGFFHVPNTEGLQQFLDSGLDVLCSALFYWATFSYWSSGAPRQAGRNAGAVRFSTWLYNHRSDLKWPIFLFILGCGAFLMADLGLGESSLMAKRWSGAFNFFALLLMAFYFDPRHRYQKLMLGFGFAIWAVLQFYVFLPEDIIKAETIMILGHPIPITAIGFSASFVAKGLILAGLFSTYVSKVSEAELKLRSKEVEMKAEQKALEKVVKENDRITALKQDLSDILTTTFHEIVIPLKSLEQTVDDIADYLKRDNERSIYEQLVSDSEGVKTVVIVAKMEFAGQIGHDLKLDTGEWFLDQEEEVVSLNTLVQLAVRSIKNTSPWRAKLDWQVSYGGQCFVECNKNEIIQVIVNLLKNAIEAYHETDAEDYLIIVRTFLNKWVKGESRKVFLEIEDRAGGIHNDHKNRVWERGFSTKPLSDQKISRGNGLYISKSIIDKHANCHIILESPIVFRGRGQVQGTKFIIEFNQADT